MWFGLITLFPEICQALQIGITGRALKEQIIQLSCWNPRDFATDKHKSVDDHPYGGGPGMVMMADPLIKAIQAAKKAAPELSTVVYLSPQGRVFNQETAIELAHKKSVIFVAGRYEGIDERIIQQEIDEEWSLGDFVLTGGELAAMSMIDAATRLLPGALGDAESAQQDSLAAGLLKYPQYTRPDNYGGLPVPEVLLSGNHKDIERWRLKQSLGRTWLKKPDLLAKKQLTEAELALLNEFISEFLQK